MNNENNTKIQDYLISMKKRYLPDAIESLKNNSHQSEIQFHEIKFEWVEKVMIVFLEKVQKKDFSDIVSSIPLLESLESLAISKRRDLDKSIDQKVIDAILVNFINYVGMHQGVNYALETQNICK